MEEVNVFKLHKMVQKTKDQIKAKIEKKKYKDYKSFAFKLGGRLLWDRPWEARL